jgi:glyoxylase-like metal-dependent hydrolase (beta-lactamase superfamily II)
MEHESPFGELALTSPDGQIVHTLDWQTDAPVKLLKNLMRLTAPNPGVMTGPGTNSYLVGDALSGYIAIDPGPADADHLQRLYQAAGGDIRLIVCTHSHPDHSPGARPLQALCEAAGKRPLIAGLPSADTARADSTFTPDWALSNHELLTHISRGQKPDLKAENSENSHTLKVLFTPGHAANHLCLVLLEDGLLFSGDHILNGSTTVINPPDGNMNAYLDSLDLLSQACDENAIDFILPAHGYVIGQAKTAIAQLRAHRLKREAKIIGVMQALPDGTLDDWVPLAYDDVDQRIWPVAKRSLLAHVERIQSMPQAGK